MPWLRYLFIRSIYCTKNAHLTRIFSSVRSSVLVKIHRQYDASKLKYGQNYKGLAMPNPALTQSARHKNVANMLATLRIEKLSPSESLKPPLQAYVDGHKTTTDLLSEVKPNMSRYDADEVYCIPGTCLGLLPC